MPKQKAKRGWLAGAVLQNPVLVQAGGLTAIIVAATTLQGAVWIAVLAAVHLIICELLASVMKPVPLWLRAGVYFAVGLAIACPATYLMGDLMNFLTRPIAGEATEQALEQLASRLAMAGSLAPLRVFLPLMAVNALTAMRCERYAVLHSPGDALRDALANSLGYAGAAILTGAVRELLGYGTLWGMQVSKNLHIRGIWMPFGGFLLLGAMAALLKVILRRLSARGIYIGAEKALELAPEDRLERLEKTRQLLISEVREAMRDENENAEMRNEGPEEEPEEEIAEEEAPPPRMPVEAILREYGLDDALDSGEGVSAQAMAPLPLTEDEKLRLVLELEALLHDFEGGEVS